MKKIFELTSKDFFSGVSQMSHGSRGGLFYAALGISPFVNTFYESNDFGLLQTQSVPVDMTGEIVKDVVRNWVVEATAANTGYLYGYGSGGNFYVIVLSNNAITNERAGGSVIANPAFGMIIYREKLYYAQLTQIGEVTEGTPPFDTGSTWDDDYSGTTGSGSALESTIYHPMHLFSGRVWIGNKFYIDSISGTTPDYNSHVLTLETDFNVMCIDDDGFYIIAGVTQNLGDSTIMAKTKVIFWDTFSSLVSREWEIPEPNINAIKKLGGWLYAFCGRGIYRFSYSSPPQKITPTLNAADALQFGRHQGVDNWGGDMLIWGGSQIRTFGSPIPGYPQAFFTPFAGIASTHKISAITTNAKSGSIYGSTSDSKVLRWNTITGGATSLNATTNFIPLREKYLVQEIKLILGTDLASGDSLNVDVSADDGDTVSDWGTASFANHGAVRRVTLTGSFEAEALQLVLNYNGGNVKIKRIEVYGTPQLRAMK